MLLMMIFSYRIVQTWCFDGFGQVARFFFAQKPMAASDNGCMFRQQNHRLNGENLMEMIGPYFRHHTSTVKIVQDERDLVSVHLITTRTRRKKLETSVLRSFFFWVLTSSKLCKPLSESSKVQISKAHSNYSNITTLSFYQVVILITVYHLIEWSYITLIYADHHLCKPRTQITLVLVGSSALFWRVDLQK